MANRTASRAEHSKVAQGFGRAGIVCHGIVHPVIAYLAIRIAAGSGQQQADQKGALAEIGSTSFGRVALWVLAIGLIAYGLWQFLMAAKGYWRISEKPKRITRRVGSAARGWSASRWAFQPSGWRAAAVRAGPGNSNNRSSPRGCSHSQPAACWSPSRPQR
jgi:hypothetical protein